MKPPFKAVLIKTNGGRKCPPIGTVVTVTHINYPISPDNYNTWGFYL